MLNVKARRVPFYQDKARKPIWLVRYDVFIFIFQVHSCLFFSVVVYLVGYFLSTRVLLIHFCFFLFQLVILFYSDAAKSGSFWFILVLGNVIFCLSLILFEACSFKFIFN